MAQTLYVGSGKTYTTLAAAITALGNIAGTGANEIVVDAGYVLTENFTPARQSLNSGTNAADSLTIRSSDPNQRFILNTVTAASYSINIDDDGIKLRDIHIKHATTNSALYLGRDNCSIYNFVFENTHATNYVPGVIASVGKETKAELGYFIGNFSSVTRYVKNVTAISSYGSYYGVRDSVTVTDCAVFNPVYSACYSTNTTLVNCASSDSSGSTGLTGLVATEQFVSPTTYDFTLKEGTVLANAGSVYTNVGYDQSVVVTKPVVSAVASSSITTTGFSVGYSVDKAPGTLYAVLTSGSTTPSIAQIKAGQNSAGTAAVSSTSVAVTITGAQTALSFSGLTQSTQYYVHLVYNDGTTDSVISTITVTTVSASTPTLSIISTLRPGISVTISGANLGATQGTVSIAGVAQTVTAWTASSITFTASTFQNTKYGTVTVTVTPSGGSALTMQTTLIPAAGKSYVDILAPLTDGTSILKGCTETPVSGDQVLYDSLTSGGKTVTMRTNGQFVITAAGATTQTFSVSLFDSATNEWTNTAVVTVN